MKIVFNSSLPRSGSTLLQNILAQNPRFYCSPTSGVLELLFAARANFTNLNEFKLQPPDVMKTGWLGYCRGAIDGWYSAITDKQVAVDKSRGWIAYYHWLTEFCPDAKIIVCVRDIRAIISSMEKLHRRNQHLADPAEDANKLQMVSLESRIKHWLGTPPVGLALQRLRNALHEGIGDKLHFFIYENLVNDPGTELAKLYAYLGEPAFDHSVFSIAQTVTENDAVHGAYGDHKIRAVLSADKPDWNMVLGREISQAIVDNHAWFYDRFYP